MKLIIIIPSYNEDKSLGAVIEGIPKKIEVINEILILVINDGSTDRTTEGAIQSGAYKIITHKHNMDLAQTIQEMLNGALDMGADFIASSDADFQYNGTEIPKHIKPILEGNTDFILDNRQIDTLDHMRFEYLWENMHAILITRLAKDLPIKDAQTGFLAFSRKSGLSMNLTGDYIYPRETIIKVVNKHFKIKQVPDEFRRLESKSQYSSGFFYQARSSVCC